MHKHRVVLIGLSIVAASIMHAVPHQAEEVERSYDKMSTLQLQEEVEKLSQKRELPFAMGLELMSRWTKEH